MKNIFKDQYDEYGKKLNPGYGFMESVLVGCIVAVCVRAIRLDGYMDGFKHATDDAKEAIRREAMKNV